MTTLTFGIDAQSRSTKWDEVRKGPPSEAVLQHLHKVVHYRETQARNRGWR